MMTLPAALNAFAVVAVVVMVFLPSTVNSLTAKTPVKTPPTPEMTVNLRDTLTMTSRRQVLKEAVSTSLPLLLVTSPTTSRAEDSNKDYKDGPEGLKYIVTEPGNPNGVKPERAQEVQTLYTLYLNGFPEDNPSESKQIDGTKKFYGEQPFKVRAGVKAVIRGWDLALMDMVEGEARRLIIPSALGYGDKGVGPIPGKATLYFDVKLLKLEPVKPLTEQAKQWLEEHPL